MVLHAQQNGYQVFGKRIGLSRSSPGRMCFQVVTFHKIRTCTACHKSAKGTSRTERRASSRLPSSMAWKSSSTRIWLWLFIIPCVYACLHDPQIYHQNFCMKRTCARAVAICLRKSSAISTCPRQWICRNNCRKTSKTTKKKTNKCKALSQSMSQKPKPKQCLNGGGWCLFHPFPYASYKACAIIGGPNAKPMRYLRLFSVHLSARPMKFIWSVRKGWFWSFGTCGAKLDETENMTLAALRVTWHLSKPTHWATGSVSWVGSIFLRVRRTCRRLLAPN